MFTLLLSCLFLFVNAEPLPETDLKCFNNNYNKTKTFEPAPNSTMDTFEVRVEHKGDFTDFFTIGDLYTLKKDEPKAVNSTTLSVHMVCILFHYQLGDSKLCNGTTDGEILDEERNLYVVFTGTQVCSGMLEKEINITSTDTIPSPSEGSCAYKCVNATLDAPNMKFPYYDWNINVNNKTGTFTDTLVVKAGTANNIASILIVLCLSIMAKLA